jgi:uncharacterized protein
MKIPPEEIVVHQQELARGWAAVSEDGSSCSPSPSGILVGCQPDEEYVAYLSMRRIINGMIFEWDTQKSLINKEKHGIDFEAAEALWLDEDRVEIEITFPDERRWALIATMQGKAWTAIYTIRGEAIRLISVRRARTKEARLYEEETSG